MGNGSGMGMWGFGLLLVVGVGLLVVLAVRALGGGVTRGPRVGPNEPPRDGIGTLQPQDAPAPGPGRAREILDERYARGELSTEEYRERLQRLGEGG